MPKNTRVQRYKEWFCSRAQRLKGRLVCLWIKRMARVWRWGPVILQATWNEVRRAWNGVRRAADYLRRNPSFRWAGIGLIVILILWKLPAWQVAGAKLSDEKRLELIDKTRGTLAQILAGAGIALGLYFTWRRVAAAERTVQVAEEGQITERFTRAIDQLGATDEHGHKRLELRLGGIYALERIARDSEKDHRPIMEVLTAYVREHAPWKERAQPQQDRPPDPEALPAGNATQQQEPQAQPTPDTDIQAILTVIGRRTRWFGKGEDQRLNLSRTDMHGATLFRAHLEEAIFMGAHLEGAYLIGAYLQGVNLYEAHLEGADFRGAYGLTREQLADAFTEGTLLPDYLTSSQATDNDEDD